MIVRDTINPSTLRQALEAAAQPGVRVMAGGTDLLVRLHDLIDTPWPPLVVLDGVKPLSRIALHDDHISIGPLVTFSEIENSAILNKYACQLVEAASIAGSVQIRNRATIGGNIANASPAGDLIPPLFVLGATLDLSSLNRKRKVPIEKFFKGPGKTILKSTELITSIRIPTIKSKGFFLRLGTRRALTISKVSVAAAIKLKGGKVETARIALGAVAPTVISAKSAEEILAGNRLDIHLIARAAEVASSMATPIDDIRSLGDYRKEMVRVLLRRGLITIMDSLNGK